MNPRDRKKILAVDDQPINLQIYEMLFADEYQLETATSGEEALVTAARFRPDVILLDVMMPGLSGYETCHRLRADRNNRFCKILLVSAESMAADRLKGYEVGADDYVTKPFHEDELIAKVGVFVRLKFAEEVDQLKTEVLTLLCHETRTPLNFVITPAEILAAEGELDEEKRREWGTMILDGMRSLHGLFEKVMLLSQFKSGKPDARHSACDIVGVIAGAVAKLEDIACARGISVHLDLPDSILVHANHDHLEVVFGSLLDNAIRFSRENGEVTIAVERIGAEVRVSVVDHGVGIAAEHLSTVFEEFVAHDVLHHSEGHGLSLALSRAIVEHLGGSIDVASQPDRETTFRVQLPLLASPPDAASE